jgi:hypothetical protein
LLAEDLAVIGAVAISLFTAIIASIIVFRRHYAKLHPPLTSGEIELQLEKELEKVNKEIESLNEGKEGR